MDTAKRGPGRPKGSKNRKHTLRTRELSRLPEGDLRPDDLGTPAAQAVGVQPHEAPPAEAGAAAPAPELAAAPPAEGAAATPEATPSAAASPPAAAAPDADAVRKAAAEALGPAVILIHEIGVMLGGCGVREEFRAPLADASAACLIRYSKTWAEHPELCAFAVVMAAISVENVKAIREKRVAEVERRLRPV